MSRVYGEPVTVQAREDGRPVSFAWRGRWYAVIAVQEHWMVNRDWWREPGPAPARPELQFWRVEASADPGGRRPAPLEDPLDEPGEKARLHQTGAVGIYEFRRDIAADTWTLRRIAD